MEATQPKVHRQHQRQRRTEARQRRLEREAATAAASTPPDAQESQDITETLESCAAALNDTASTTTATTVVGRISAQSSADSIEMVGSPSQTSQQTVVLVNGHAPPTQDTLEESVSLGADVPEMETTHLESPTQNTQPQSTAMAVAIHRAMR